LRHESSLITHNPSSQNSIGYSLSVALLNRGSKDPIEQGDFLCLKDLYLKEQIENGKMSAKSMASNGK
jgi:hypothetical protein